MITTVPIKIRGAMVTASSVPYPDTGETAWADATVYAIGDTRSYLIGDLYHKFECKLGHTSDTATGKVPEAFPDDVNNAYWIDLGAVNKYAPFQLERNTQNSASSPFTVSVNPGDLVGCIGIGNIVADAVTLEIYDGATVVYTETRDLMQRAVYDWYTWTYAPFRQVKKTLFTDLPMNSTYTLKLTFTRSTGKINIGQIIAGVPFDIGIASETAKVMRENFSPVTRNSDGEAKFNKKRNIPSNQLELLISKGALDSVLGMIDDLNSEITLWAGEVETTDGYFEGLFTIGFYKQFSHSFLPPNNAVASIEIQEL